MKWQKYRLGKQELSILKTLADYNSKVIFYDILRSLVAGKSGLEKETTSFIASFSRSMGTLLKKGLIKRTGAIIRFGRVYITSTHMVELTKRGKQIYIEWKRRSL